MRVELYANGHGGAYPDSLEQALDHFGDDAGEDVCDCPIARRGVTRAATRPSAGDPPDYAYAGRGLTKGTVTAAHVILSDRPQNHDRGAYDLKVMYGDGAIRDVTRGVGAGDR
jgi:hypothetical protein